MIFEQVMEGLGLAPRAQQVALLAYARTAMSQGATEMVQAGTGTGKSYVLLSAARERSQETGLPSVVVCPTNRLIDQYIEKDMPSVRGVVGGSWAQIKGRGRYVCASSYKLFMARNRAEQFRKLAAVHLEWEKLGLTEEWACPGFPVCKSRPDCDHEDFCDCEPLCGAMIARQRAASADVVITNAHVLMWDRMLRSWTMGMVGLLPDHGALFVDECHELEAVARSVLSVEIKSTGRMVTKVDGLSQWIQKTLENMKELGESERELVEDEDLTKMAVKARILAADLLSTMDTTPDEQKMADTLNNFYDMVVNKDDRFVTLIEMQDDPKHFVVGLLRKVCINASYELREIIERQPTLLVSGTIPASDRRRLGLHPQMPLRDVGHPFNYGNSQLLVSQFSPKEPRDLSGRVAGLARAINQTGGGTMVLFTSWKDLEEVMPLVAKQLLPGIDVYMQSREGGLSQDIEDFKRDGNAVLAGVRSLVTGVDIPGPALRQVVWWKLPWPSPTIEIRKIIDIFGQQTYRDMMMMQLVQGIGRLVRTVDDCGRVIIFDSRAKRLDWEGNPMSAHLAEFRGY